MSLRYPTISTALLFVMITFSGKGQVSAQYLPQLNVGPNHQFLYTAEGKPFFWLGDTAWELFHRLDREEAEKYLRDRAEKGFTVIQAVVLAELDGLNTPNAHGHTPLMDNDPASPKEAYFKHVDFIVDLVEAARAKDGSFGVIYIPTGKDIAINSMFIKGERINAWWFNPRQNAAQLIGEFPKENSHTFHPPSTGRNNDWVLVLDDASVEMPQLGTSYQHLVPKVD